VLIIAKVDRLSRDVEFLFKIRNSGVDILAADAPHMGTLEWGIRAVFAQHEREEISRRTKAALASGQGARGEAWLSMPGERRECHGRRGAARSEKAIKRAWPVIRALHDNGASLRKIAANLNEDEVPSVTGGKWYASSVRNVLQQRKA
jgi:DNA invertase Pin-like site-specific DNA recombinase